MENKKFENVVVGTGISSLGAIIGLINNKKKILIIDTPKIIKTHKNKLIFCNQNLPIVKINNWNKLNIANLLSLKNYGGHSNIWGGSCLRLEKNEFFDWPISYREISFYYKKCEKFLKIYKPSNDVDDKKLTDKTKGLSIKLQKGIIAKSFKNKEKVFNTREVIDHYLKTGKVSIIKADVEKFVRKKNTQYLTVKKNHKKIYFKNLYIGAGSINTSKIIKKSIKNKKLKNIKQSQSFFVPVLMFKKLKNLNSKSSYQIVVKNFFNKNRNLHMELKYSPFFTKKTIQRKIGFLSFLMPNFIINRLIILTGFLPSCESVNFIQGKVNKNKKFKINAMRLKLNKIFKKLDKKFSFYIFSRFIKFTQFGRSFHVGANIPMNNDKDHKFLNVDKNGKIKHKNFENIYIIDSSVFPLMPSGVLGLTSMANAYRIIDKKFNDFSN